MKSVLCTTLMCVHRHELCEGTIYKSHIYIVALSLQPIPYFVSDEVGFTCLNGNARYRDFAS